MKARLFILGMTAAAGIAFPALAHHSFAMYDRAQTIRLNGVVKDYIWTSPHVTIEVLAERPGGGDLTWVIEGSPPSVLARGGWTASLLRPGDKVSLAMHPRRDGTAGGLLADEQQMLVNGEPPKGVLWLVPYAPPR